jgi:hypothetical protein
VRAKGFRSEARRRRDPVQRDAVIEPDEDFAEVDEEGAQLAASSGARELAGQGGGAKGRELHLFLRRILCKAEAGKEKRPGVAGAFRNGSRDYFLAGTEVVVAADVVVVVVAVVAV